MNLSKVYSAQFDVLKSFIVEIEADIVKKGNPVFKIVGLPDKAVEEAKERVSAAVKNSGFENPQRNKITVSLSPADIKKTGPIFDLPIALAIILANGEVNFSVENKIFLGELSLDGKLRKISGILPMVKAAKDAGFKSIYLPSENKTEAAVVSNINVFPVNSLSEIIKHLLEENTKEKKKENIIKPFVLNPEEILNQIKKRKKIIDFSDVRGQEVAKRALEIAAAGGHNLAMYGPPGTGKTMLARAFCGILPELSEEQALEVTQIHSAAGVLDTPYINTPPFRSPHHTASYVAVIGGGVNIKPGEATLAHRGILFLDEFVEFDKRVLESLREPMEDGFVNISRAKGTAKFPSNFILIAALNPPSEVYSVDGFVSRLDRQKFKKKLSGPIIDRIDLWAEVDKIDYDKIIKKDPRAIKSEIIKKGIEKVRKIQKIRYNSEKLNADISVQDIDKYINLGKKEQKLLEQSAERLNFSPRVFHKIIKISRTIADLDHQLEIEMKHILEALQYRPKEII